MSSQHVARRICPHPGDILQEEFLTPFGLSHARAAADLGVEEFHISALVAGAAAIDAEMAMRLSRYFGTSAVFWMNLQTHYDLDMTRAEMEETITDQVRPLKKGVPQQEA